MATRTTVVHCRREAYDVYIGRPTEWGNPFRAWRESDRETVVAQYREWIKTQPHLMARIPELRGKRLGCYCAPKLCHGHVLAELADGLEATG